MLCWRGCSCSAEVCVCLWLRVSGVGDWFLFALMSVVWSNLFTCTQMCTYATMYLHMLVTHGLDICIHMSSGVCIYLYERNYMGNALMCSTHAHVPITHNKKWSILTSVLLHRMFGMPSLPSCPLLCGGLFIALRVLKRRLASREF